MFYKPDLIVYLWLVPVILMVVIPAALATCRSFMCIMKGAPVEEEYAVEQEALAKA